MNTVYKARHAAQSARRDVKNRLYRLTGEAREGIRRSGAELLVDAQEQGERTLKSARGWVSRNPGAAIGWAFAAGAACAVLLPRAMRRERSDS